MRCFADRKEKLKRKYRRGFFKKLKRNEIGSKG
jgi:hypothetical protein